VTCKNNSNKGAFVSTPPEKNANSKAPPPGRGGECGGKENRKIKGKKKLERAPYKHREE